MSTKSPSKKGIGQTPKFHPLHCMNIIGAPQADRFGVQIPFVYPHAAPSITLLESATACLAGGVLRAGSHLRVGTPLKEQVKTVLIFEGSSRTKHRKKNLTSAELASKKERARKLFSALEAGDFSADSQLEIYRKKFK